MARYHAFSFVCPDGVDWRAERTNYLFRARKITQTKNPATEIMTIESAITPMTWSPSTPCSAPLLDNPAPNPPQPQNSNFGRNPSKGPMIHQIDQRKSTTYSPRSHRLMMPW